MKYRYYLEMFPRSGSAYIIYTRDIYNGEGYFFNNIRNYIWKFKEYKQYSVQASNSTFIIELFPRVELLDIKDPVYLEIQFEYLVEDINNLYPELKLEKRNE